MPDTNPEPDPSATALLRAATSLATSLDALAALAAHLRVETEGLDVDPQVRRLLSAITAEVLGGVEHIPDATRRAVVGMTRAFLHQAGDLVDHPGRAGGWAQPEDALLQGIGRLSTAIVGAVQAAEHVLDGLGASLRSPDATFLDVGTGTAWLAIAMAHAYPQLRVTGIDVFEPALALARQNVAAEQMIERVELRHQDGSDLSGSDRYDLIWMPMPFLPLGDVPDVLHACAAALRPGGWLVAGTFGGSGGHLSELLMELRTVRSGGHAWRPDELLRLLDEHGLVDACEVPRTWAAPVLLYAGRARSAQG